MSAPTQRTRLLNALRRRAMTTLQIRASLGIGHPAGRVQELRADGHDIKADIVPVRNRYGETAYVARYAWRGRRAP